GSRLRIAAAQGGSHACFSDAVGMTPVALYCFGSNDHGESVPSDPGGCRFGASIPPVDVAWADPGNALQLAAAGNHSCAMSSSDRLYCWGDDDYFETGAPLVQIESAPGLD